jgi:hypothetical protein
MRARDYGHGSALSTSLEIPLGRRCTAGTEKYGMNPVLATGISEHLLMRLTSMRVAGRFDGSA